MLLRRARLGGALVDLRTDDGVITELAPSLISAGSEQVVDLDGRFINPGLWDNHVHANQWALTSQRLDVSEAGSAREVAAMVGAALEFEGEDAANQGAGRYVGMGFRDAMWTDAPNLADLDAVTGDYIVVLLSGDLHSAWLNSAALADFGYAGHPTGLLREDAAFEVTTRLADVSPELLDRWVVAAGRRAAARGVVGVVDLEMAWNFEAWMRRREVGFDGHRVEFGIYAQDLDQAIALGLHTGQRLDELITVGKLKVLTDGSLNTRTAWCVDTYPGTDSHGQLEVPAETLIALMRRAAAAGIESTVHAIGDAANTLALDAFEALGTGGSIEHAQLLVPSDIPRFARLGVIASVQPEHAMDDRDVAERYWAGRTDRTFPLRSLLDAGARLQLGSDAPVAPLDPWASMASAVGRARPGREPWHPEQSITVAEALAASTRTSVAVGQPADLVLTEVDPLQCSADELRAMAVSATLLAGDFTYSGGL